MDKRCTLYKEEYLNTFNYFQCLYEYYRKVKRCGLGVFANIYNEADKEIIDIEVPYNMLDFITNDSFALAEDFHKTEDGKALLEKLPEELERIEVKRLKKELSEKQRKARWKKIAQMELEAEGVLFEKANRRPPIPEEVKDFVWRRDGGRCVMCGSNKDIQFDHIIPFYKGGATSIENLQILCQSCNLKKSNHIG